MMTTTATSITTTLSRRLADWVVGVTIDDVPRDVITTAKQHALDALGIAIASSGMDYGEAMHNAAVKLGSSTDSGAVGFGTRLPAPSAALLNGTLIHGLDFDDTHIGAIYHATGPALAAALAVGEAEPVDGATVLLAYIIGMEVGCRLASAGAGLFHARGFHPTGIAGTFAAACVTAKIRGLSAEELASALGLCGSQAAGILELHDSWLKRMHPGWAAHSGIIAATMAQAGFRGPATVFEGAGGLYRSHLEKIPTAQELGLEDLGERWMTAEIALKPYPCCHFTHAFADAAYGVLDELGRESLDPQDVESIVCPTTPGLLPIVFEPTDRKVAPKTIYDALFSTQFVVANVLSGRPINLTTFYDEPLDDPAVLALASRVSSPPDRNVDFPQHFSGEVQLHLTDGRVVGRKVRDSHGTPQDPMSNDEVRAKFRSTAERRVSPAQAAKIAATVNELETLLNVGQLVEACVVPGEM
jgi:2-methylcitrate dehydratase PrpD